MDHPENRDPTEDEAGRAARGALAREWKDLEAELGTPIEDETAELERKIVFTARAQALWAKHRAVLEKDGVNVDAAIADVGQKLDTLVRADTEEREAEEKLLHATATFAEASTVVVEQLLNILLHLESLSEAQWAEMDWPAREKTREVLDDLQEQAPSLLAELPLEKRREIEARRGSR